MCESHYVDTCSMHSFNCLAAATAISWVSLFPLILYMCNCYKFHVALAKGVCSFIVFVLVLATKLSFDTCWQGIISIVDACGEYNDDISNYGQADCNKFQYGSSHKETAYLMLPGIIVLYCYMMVSMVYC